MRVLHVYKSYYPDSVGGIEQVIYQLAGGLSGLGVENRVLTLSTHPSPAVLSRPEGEVHRFQTTFEAASNPMSIAAWRAYDEQVQWADVVHFQFPWPFADLLHVTSRQHRPSVVTYQSDVVRQRRLMWAYRPLMQRFLSRVDAIVATSPNYLASSPVLRGIRRPIDIVPNGIDEASVPVPEADAIQAWRSRLGEHFLLFVGVLRYYKGLHVLLHAASRVRAPIVIAGGGPELAALKAQAASLGLTNVHFLGEVAERDKVALYALATGFVFPSNLRSEAFGMSLVEAALFGKPMITCEIGTGTSYINLDGVTGRTVPPDDPDALAVAMQRLLDSPEDRARMGAAARQRYEVLLSRDTMARSYHQIYRRFTGEAVQPPSPGR